MAVKREKNFFPGFFACLNHFLRKRSIRAWILTFCHILNEIWFRW